MKRSIFLIILLSMISISAGPAEALELVFDYNYVYTGTAPGGTAPWLRVTFENMGSYQGNKIVRLTFEALSLQAAEFVTNWYFNVNPNIDLGTLQTTYLFGPSASFSFGADQFKAPGDGKFDMKVSFPTANSGRFDYLGIASYQLESPDSSFGISSFKFYSAPDTGSSKVFLSAAHVQGIATGAGSGHVSPGEGISPAPEAGTLLLFGIALIGIAVVMREMR